MVALLNKIQLCSKHYTLIAWRCCLLTGVVSAHLAAQVRLTGNTLKRRNTPDICLNNTD